MAVAVNEDALPKIDTLFEKDSDDWKQWQFVRSLANQEEKAEAAALNGKRHVVEPLTPTQGVLDHEKYVKNKSFAVRGLLKER